MGVQVHSNNKVRCAMMINIINNELLAKLCLAVKWYRTPKREGNRSQEKSLCRDTPKGGANVWTKRFGLIPTHGAAIVYGNHRIRGRGTHFWGGKESSSPEIRSGFYGFVLVGVCYNFVCLSQYGFSVKVIFSRKLISRREKSSIPS